MWGLAEEEGKVWGGGSLGTEDCEEEVPGEGCHLVAKTFPHRGRRDAWGSPAGTGSWVRRGRDCGVGEDLGCLGSGTKWGPAFGPAPPSLPLVQHPSAPQQPRGTVATPILPRWGDLRGWVLVPGWGWGAESAGGEPLAQPGLEDFCGTGGVLPA